VLQHASIFTRFVSIGAKVVTLPWCVPLKYTQLAPPQDSAQGAVFRETQMFMKTWTGFGQTTDEDFVQGNKQRHWSWDYVIFIFIHLIHCNIYHSNVRTNQLKRTAQNGPRLTQVPSIMYVPLERILVRTQNSRPHDPHSWWGAERRAFPVRSEGPETVKLKNRQCPMKTLTRKLVSGREDYDFFTQRKCTAFACTHVTSCDPVATVRHFYTFLSSRQVVLSFQILFTPSSGGHYLLLAVMKPR